MKTKNEIYAVLKEKGRFYTCGWFDALRGEKPQANDNERFSDLHDQYVQGYNDELLYRSIMRGRE